MTEGRSRQEEGPAVATHAVSGVNGHGITESTDPNPARKKGRTNTAKDLQVKGGSAGLLKWSEEVNYSPERTVLDSVIEER